MDPDRVHAYLQICLAGLGFDIGEVWVTSSTTGSSTVVPIDECQEYVSGGRNEKDRRLRFLQLYTSKSYDDQRCNLLCPPNERRRSLQRRGSFSEDDDIDKHVLSPKLVDAICCSMQMVWATCHRREGLLGKSEVCLHTAVGMPVAVDSRGNICVVIMFSRNDIPSHHDAVEYLKLISKSAASSKVPCLLPVVSDANLLSDVVKKSQVTTIEKFSSRKALPDGVKVRYISMNDDDEGTQAEIRSVPDLKAAPKDTFGIPILPTQAEICSQSTFVSEQRSTMGDPFDEASYGVWSTIMNSNQQDYNENDEPKKYPQSPLQKKDLEGHQKTLAKYLSTLTANVDVILTRNKRERLEEFASAFLDLSLFDIADVWIPSSVEEFEYLIHRITVGSSSIDFGLVENFKNISSSTPIEMWSGAVGRAYGSGNPVWSSNQDIICDTGRHDVFDLLNIQTVLAIPLYSPRDSMPTCIISFYALVRVESTSFVLRFLQESLRMIWEGLDSVVTEMPFWKNVQPADLGEMAADTEMQNFFHRKRPHEAISRSFSNLSLKSLENTANETLELEETRVTSEAVELHQSSVDMAQHCLPCTPNITMTVLYNEFKDEDYDCVIDNTDKKSDEFRQACIQSMGDAIQSIGGAVPLLAQWNDETVQNDIECPMTKPSESSTEWGTSLPVPLVQPAVTNKDYRPLAWGKDGVTSIENNSSDEKKVILMSHIDHSKTSFGEKSNDNNQIHKKSKSGGMIVQSWDGTGTFAESDHLTNPGIVSFMSGESFDYYKSDIPDMNASVPVRPTHHTKQRLCRITGCEAPACGKRPYCIQHNGNRLCEFEGCNKCAQGATRFCIGHGGGRRCTFPGCDKGARDKFFCAAHGGGKRCAIDGCNKSAVGGSNLCTSHGGGRRCTVQGCLKSAQSTTQFCVKHGGGKKCLEPGCERVARGKTCYCAAHGGGVRCKMLGCNRVAVGKRQLCRSHGGGSQKS